MRDQNVPCAVQHRPQRRVAFFCAHADVVARPGIEEAEIVQRDGPHIGLPLADRPLHARSVIPTFRQVRLLGFGQTL